MKRLFRYGVVALCGMIVTISFLSIILIGALGLELSSVIERMISHLVLCVFPILILLEFCFFANDLLVYLSKTFHFEFGLQFSEVRINYDLDNYDTPIPLKTKLFQLYPFSIGLTMIAFILVLFTR